MRDKRRNWAAHDDAWWAGKECLGFCSGARQYRETAYMTFDEYLDDIPQLHTWDGGLTWNTGGFDRSHLQRMHDFLKSSLPPSCLMIETGAGNSTICFSFLKPSHHWVICPDEPLVERVQRFLRWNDLPIGHLDVRIGRSEHVLPELAALTREGDAPLHFGLLDGGHNWPTVFVDFCYINYMLREGGYLMIDDVQLHSVKELARLLAEEPGFELALDIGKSLIFRKTTADRHLGEWNASPYIRRRSEENMRLPDPYALRSA
jgi:hypothetical protein